MESKTKPTELARKCYLTNIPAELRHRIYDLVFNTSQQEGVVDLLAASPPSKSLTLACHQIESESSKLYKIAYRRFWSETHFKLTVDKTNLVFYQIALAELKPEDLTAVQNLTLNGSSSDYVFTRSDNLWEATDPRVGVHSKPRLIILSPDAKVPDEYTHRVSHSPQNERAMTVHDLDKAVIDFLVKQVGRHAGVTKGELLYFIRPFVRDKQRAHERARGRS